MKARIKKVYEIFKKAGKGMSNDSVTMMGAAVAYYTMFSLAPLLVIAIGVAGVIFGESASIKVFDAIKGMVGPQGARAVQSMVTAAARRPHAGFIATIVGVVTLIVGASSVFSQLQQSLNIIWKIGTHPKAGWWILIRQRLFSFGMVAVIGFVLLVSMVVSAALTAAGTWAGGAMPGGKALWSAINFIVSLLIIGFMFSALLKLLPDVKLTWKDVRIGGWLTALLFVAGKTLIGAYIGRTGVATSYGAAGSLIVILLWVFYSSQILFFGAEFTRAWATRDGRKIEPKPGAVFTVPAVAAASLAENLAEHAKDPEANVMRPPAARGGDHDDAKTEIRRAAEHRQGRPRGEKEAHDQPPAAGDAHGARKRGRQGGEGRRAVEILRRLGRRWSRRGAKR